jgi:amino acid transporter
MGKKLERDLGLPSVMAISIGAMVGSGIFILPGEAMKFAGPAVVLAYLLAAVLVLPAALSKSEMATAMPESGGTYLYVERGMGPLLGTVAGVGTWFSLAFKGGLALVGGAPYLVYYLDLPVTPVAFTVGLILVVVNIVGVKQTGRMQIAFVVLMLLAMVWFTVSGAPSTEATRFDGLFDSGGGGLLTATGFVFVSYAGVTKVASVAEEVEDPGRTLPLGMLGSLIFTTLVYVGIVAVMVGVAPADELQNSAVPMVVAAQQILPGIGVAAVVVAALLALISTANAGILSSSRYPFAMSRDGLAPDYFEQISDRFNTPVRAINVTGAMLLLLVFVPVSEIAKLASAFQIIVFVLVNIAVIAFRQGNIEAYEPTFETPVYPLPQVVGIVGGLALLPFMGLLPLAGALVITAGSLAWYYLVVSRRGGVDREGAATDALRRSVGRQIVAETETHVDQDTYEVLVAVTESTPREVEQSLIGLATDVARSRDGAVRVVRFDQVPDQAPLERSAELVTEGDRAFEARLTDRATDEEVPIEYGEIVSHDTRHAIVNYAEEIEADALAIEQLNQGLATQLLGDISRWVEDHAPCDVIEVANYDRDDMESVAVVTDRQPFDPAKVAFADAIATRAGARIEFYGATQPGRLRRELESRLF